MVGEIGFEPTQTLRPSVLQTGETLQLSRSPITLIITYAIGMLSRANRQILYNYYEHYPLQLIQVVPVHGHVNGYIYGYAGTYGSGT